MNHKQEGEIRVDFLGRVVIITPARSLRPHDFKDKKPKPQKNSKDCFFCPGNEYLTPKEIDRTMLKNGGWLNRVFENKFPALSTSWSKAYGIHEIVVESNEHNRTLSDLSVSQIQDYLTIIIRRLVVHSKNKKLKYCAVFKNQGKNAGASLEHGHSQLISIPFVPDFVKKQLNLCKKNPCPFCKLKKDKNYTKVYGNKTFILLSPYAPRYNYEMWIIPKKHLASLTSLNKKQITDLAKIIRIVLRTQDKLLNYPSYNMLFTLSPFNKKNFHFHIEITPRLSRWAGFELGSNIILNSYPPEIAAKDYIKSLQK